MTKEKHTPPEVLYERGYDDGVKKTKEEIRSEIERAKRNYANDLHALAPLEDLLHCEALKI